MSVAQNRVSSRHLARPPPATEEGPSNEKEVLRCKFQSQNMTVNTLPPPQLYNTRFLVIKGEPEGTAMVDQVRDVDPASLKTTYLVRRARTRSDHPQVPVSIGSRSSFPHSKSVELA